MCENRFERADTAACPAYGAFICSLCCSLDSRCHDRCKPPAARASAQWRQALAALLPRRMRDRVNFAPAQYLAVFLLLTSSMAFLISIIYVQERAHADTLRWPLVKIFSLLSVGSALCAWWVVLVSDSRRVALQESERQTQLLQKEIDAHRRTDQALQTAKEQAEAASQAKTRYVAGMAHELRTPLNTILGYTQILLRSGDSVLPASAREAVATMQQSGEHMHALIDGLLDLARIEAGRLRLDMAALHLPGFLDELVRTVRPQCEAKGLAFRLETHGRVPLWVRADAKRLRQILINLLSNAIRFTDAGQVVLRVDCRGTVLQFQVEDSGIGIEPQDHERIFMPFERGSAGRRTTVAGTGLGLSITQMLTVLMGGELTLRSQSGVGSTFGVRLYLREIAPPEVVVTPALQPTRSISGYVGSQRTLLVVDDQAVQRQLLAGLLIPLGFEVNEAASGRECLDTVAKRKPDAVLLDLSMDDMSGWDTAAVLRQRHGPGELPIVIVSADLFENQGERVTAAGCQGFVGKPVIESELVQVLGHALGLEWIYEQEAKTPALRAHPADGAAPVPLPRTLYEHMLQMARFGNASGLRQLLRASADQHPELARTLQALSTHLEQFDFAAFTQTLHRVAPLEDTDDEPVA